MIKKHIRRSFYVCIAITFLVLTLYMIGGLDSLELKMVDFRFQWRHNRPATSDIVVVTIDEPSIESLGRWPWPRAMHAKMIEILNKAGAKVVAFDSLFTEVDTTNPASDKIFADTVAKAGNVVSAFFYQNAINDSNIGQDAKRPYPALQQASDYVGFVNLDPDHDGVTRRTHLYAIDGDSAYPSLAVAALAVYKGKSFNDLLPDLPVVLGTDPNLTRNVMFINYAYSETENVYPFYSYADVLSNKVDPNLFKDKIVFVGATATALFDLKAIPFISIYHGVLIHANVVDNLINKNYITEIESYVTALYVVMIGLLLGFFLPRYNPWIKLLIFVGVVFGGFGFGLWIFKAHNVVIHMVPPLLTGLGCYGALLFYRLVIEEREKRKIKGSFKQYLSPKIIEVITKDPSKLKLGGVEREVTIFFLDIAGFTAMSEALSPTQLVEVMNQCLTQFSNVILKHEGLINKYIGDCIMAFWNAPADQTNHATLACRAALDCIASLPELNERFRSQNLPSLDCRVGINTGTVVVGNMGSKERFDYTVMGDPVNLASRLEGANKQYKSHIMISETTFEQAKKDIEARDMDLIQVKGKKEPKRVFELLSKMGELPEEMGKGRAKYHEALKLYRQRQFSEAMHAFQEVFDYMPNDHLTRVYLERCRQFTITPPPPQWDGVFEMKTK